MSRRNALVPREVRRIAVFRALQLGDLLVAVPALHALRTGFPHAEITLIGLPWAAAFARRFHRYLDRFVAFAGYPGIDEVPVEPERTVRFLEEQRAYGYDVAVQMHGSGFTSNRFVLELGAAVSAGYYDPQGGARLSIDIPYRDEGPEVLRLLEIPRLLGCPDSGTALEFPLYDEDRREAMALLPDLAGSAVLRVALHPGARSPARRWPAACFAVVGDYLAREYGARIVLVGGPGEEETARAVAGRMHEPACSLAGRTSLGGLAAVLDRMDLYIGNDTGPAHLAEALGVPSITIFGPADHRRWAPLDQDLHPIVRHPVPCSPCPHQVCPIDHRCLLRIQPREVIAAARHLLERRTMICSA